MSFISVFLAFVLDRLFAEPQRHHPLVIYGRYVNLIEARLNKASAKRIEGVIAYLLVVLPVVLVAVLLELVSRQTIFLHILAGGIVLYVAIGWQSLIDHAQAIIDPLQENNLVQAQQALAMIVSRDTEDLTEKDIAKAATESVLENGADSIFSAVFWFLLLGIPGVVLYRCSNTLDAMWGYKTQRFVHFGWCAARIDDVLNYLPARLTALSYALMGNFSSATRCWQAQGKIWKSPNAGPVMAAGAGALNVSLGGQAVYHGVLQARPLLGPEENFNTQANCQSIVSACALVNRTVLLWVISIGVLSFL